MTSIRQSTPPNMIGQVNVPLLVKNDMDAVIFNKGYDVIIENAIECPCKGSSGAPKTTCQNCLGIGWVFLNPTHTKAIVTAINNPTKYQHWSPELAGTISITLRDEDRVGFMDRVTFKSRETVMSEVLKVRDTGTNKFVFCSYRVRSIRNVFLFNSDTTKLVRLAADEYSIRQENGMVVELVDVTYPVNFNGVVSIEYMHELSYNCVDIPHDIRSTFMMNDRGQNQEYVLPIQAIARKSHLVMGEPTNYNGNNLQNNSY